MHVEIRTRGVTVPPLLRERIERRASFALDRFAHGIARVLVRLDDVNGPRGGHDKRCTVEVRLRAGGAVRATDSAPSAGAAADGALHRAAATIGRNVLRERQAMLELVALADLAR